MLNSASTRITGIGAVTGYGWGRDHLWAGLKSGKPAASLAQGFGFTNTSTTGGDDPGWIVRVPDGGHDGDGATRFARAMRFAAREAIDDGYAHGWRPGRRVGLVHAIVLGDTAMYPAVNPGAVGTYTARQYLALTPSTPVSTLMREHGFHGPAMNVSAMCTSGTAAVLTAKTWLDTNIVDDVVVVATDLSATPEIVAMFVKLGVAITDAEPLNACRPFQRGSRGFTFGEAAMAFTMSNSTTVDAYTTVLGGAMNHDGHHVTSVDPELTYVRECFTDALDNAGITGDEVRYLNAHGPGTAQCDTAEGTILTSILPNAEVYSVKPLAGHCQAAAGAVEIAATALANVHHAIPATPRVADGHPQLLDGLTTADNGITVKSSLGMGGHNAVLILADK